MEAFIANKFAGIPQTNAMLVGVHGETLQDSNRSSYNFNNASAVMELIEGILTEKRLPAKCITVISYYRAQVELISACIRNLHSDKPQLESKPLPPAYDPTTLAWTFSPLPSIY